MTDSAEFVRLMYQVLLKRAPSEHEHQQWVSFAERSSAHDVLERFARSPEYLRKAGVDSIYPPGHFHSPVVDPSTVQEYVTNERRTLLTDVSSIDLGVDKMLSVWSDMVSHIKNAPFRDEKSEGLRYCFRGGPFPYGDGLSLFALMGLLRPNRIIEIGSGYSTACMLDSIDFHDIENCHITCIEPFPDRLLGLLEGDDLGRITLMQERVQDVEAELFDSLREGDFLFIDSTHVLKTASDVHFEFFHIIPRLRPGTFIHFHDCPYPFEYPDKWIFENNHSWNEAYALRALLTNNTELGIFFWGSLMQKMFTEKVAEVSSLFRLNPGTSIWLRTR